MTTPYRGRGRGDNSRGRGRGRNNLLLQSESTVPLIGDWSAFRNRAYNTRQASASQKKEEIPSSSSKENKPSSSGTAISYREAVVNEPPPDREYVENPITENIMHLEYEDLRQTPNDGWSLKFRYLESRGYPGLHGQIRHNLEILLTVTESVTITHHFQNNNPESFINYSKCHLNKVLMPREWGMDPNTEKAIRVTEGKYIYFNYWDYIQAFSKAFYYQNPKNKHSWFFSINPEILEKPIPNWFFEWWSKFGPSLEILPDPILELYNPWNDTSPLTTKYMRQGLIYGQCPFLFFAKFQIPWIWRWSIEVTRDRLEIPILRRQFFFKWWANMPEEDLKKITNNIRTSTKEDGKRKDTEAVTEENSIENLKKYYRAKYPQESEEKIMIRVLERVKEQFMRSFNHKHSHDNMSTESHESMETNGSNQFGCLAGESQEEPTLGDWWDSMIATIEEKEKKAKGKEIIRLG